MINNRNPDAVPNVPKDEYICWNGPLKGSTLLLASAGTLPFTWHGRVGRYVADGPGSKVLLWKEL